MEMRLNRRLAVGFLILAHLPLACSRPSPKAVPSLLGPLKDPDANMRFWAARSLGQLGPEAADAVPDLIAALKDDSPMVRGGAAYALGDIGPPAATAIPALEQTARDPDKKVREGAVYALRRLKPKPAGSQRSSPAR